jgi:hypothetical protein
MTTVHCVKAARLPLSTSKVIVADDVPESELLNVNAAVWQPDVVDVNVVHVKSGMTSVTASPAERGSFNANVKVTAELAPVTGLAIVSMLCSTDGVG